VTVYSVRHETVYEYGERVVTSHNEGHLLGRRTARQTVHSLELQIDPTPEAVSWHPDYFGNDVVFFTLEEPHDRLVIDASSRVEVEPAPEPDAAASPAWEEVAAAARRARGEAWLDACQYVFDSPFVRRSDELARYGGVSFPRGRRLLDGLVDLNHRIHSDFHYETGATTLATPLHQVLAERRGVCQDFAHVMIGCLRSLGLPARYVSGYLRTHRDARSGSASGLVGAEASHAWVSAYDPGAGWLDLDPTNDLLSSDRHVILGWGRDYDDVSPVKGVTLGGGAHTVEVTVEVRPEAAPPPGR
jgi:transglutaminase-like putative cysteine protease